MTDPADQPVPLIWPSALVRPPRPPHIVYLDMKDWIALAKAATGHPDGARHGEAMRVCREARASRAALFPLSASTYMELYKIRNPRQRAHLAGVMEELSGFASLLSRTTVMALEVRAALDAMIRNVPSGQVPLIGRGVGHAMGMRGGLRMRNRAGRDVTEEYLRTTPDGAARLAEAETRMEREILRGPKDEDLPALEADGYDPVAAIRVTEQRAQQEETLRAQLDEESRWRRGRLRDVILSRELLHELQPIVRRELPVRGLDWDGLLPDRDASRRFVRGMPSTEVAVALLTERHRDGTLPWRSNDIIDIDALALAVPYCDIVVADKAAVQALSVSRVAERMGTVVLRRLADLADHLA